MTTKEKLKELIIESGCRYFEEDLDDIARYLVEHDVIVDDNPDKCYYKLTTTDGDELFCEFPEYIPEEYVAETLGFPIDEFEVKRISKGEYFISTDDEEFDEYEFFGDNTEPYINYTEDTGYLPQ